MLSLFTVLKVSPDSRVRTRIESIESQGSIHLYRSSIGKGAGGSCSSGRVQADFAGEFLFHYYLLAERLAGVVSRIISENPFGFIQGKRIHDCIAVASEIRRAQLPETSHVGRG